MKSSKNSPDVQRQKGFDHLTVARFMVSDVQAARSETTGSQIAAMMLEGFGAVPIVDPAQRLIGIVTEHDLLTSLEKNQKWGEVSARTNHDAKPLFRQAGHRSRDAPSCVAGQ